MASPDFPLWTLLPFPALVLAIAAFPMLIAHYWEKRGFQAAVVLLCAVPVVSYELTNGHVEHLRIDDPVGAWPVHGLCGIWGTLSLGLFACGQYSAAGSSPTGVPTVTPHSPEALTGLFYGGGLAVLKAQFIGSAIVCSATFAAAMVMFKALDAVKMLRVSAQGEFEGFDLDQHGASAYPEYVISTLTASHALAGDAAENTHLASIEVAGAK